LPMDSRLCTIDVRTSSRNIKSYELGYDTGIAIRNFLMKIGYDIKIYKWI
jgi:hypothetical protein